MRPCIENSVTIAAPPERVWEALTDPALTRRWIRTWWPRISRLESGWMEDDPVHWRLEDGTIGASGRVLEFRAVEKLTYTFRATDDPDSKEWVIRFGIHAEKDRTILAVSVGDSGDLAEDQACREGAAEAWSRSLSAIRVLAEELEAESWQDPACVCEPEPRWQELRDRGEI